MSVNQTNCEGWLRYHIIPYYTIPGNCLESSFDSSAVVAAAAAADTAYSEDTFADVGIAVVAWDQQLHRFRNGRSIAG